MRPNQAALGLLWSNDFKEDGRSVGKFPFMTWVNRYLASMKGSLADSTIVVRKRLYRKMHTELGQMKRKGMISTVNPLNLTMDDVGAIIQYYKSQGWKPTYVKLELHSLGSLLMFVGNPSFSMFKARHPGVFPHLAPQRNPSVEREFVDEMLGRAKLVRDNDWTRMRAYALVLFGFGTGARSKELRLAQVEDLDLKEGIFHAEHVKGEGRYGEPREVPVRPEIMPFLRRYMLARERTLLHYGKTSTVLFPALWDDGDGYLSSNSVRRIKSVVEVEMGQTFDLRTARRTYGQLLLDEGNTIETVSVTLGHSTTRTTEQFYCRKKQKTAINEARKNWHIEPATPPEKGVIRKIEYNSGYA